MTIQQLVYVLEVYNYGSISNAAKELFISQPSLSLSIKELEKELGFTLFTRTSSGVTPTHDGFVFIKRIQDVVRQFQNIKDDYSTNKSNQSFMSISATASSYSRRAFLGFCNKISKENDFELRFKSRELFEVIDDVANKHFDMGIIIISQLQKKECLLNFKEIGLEYNFIRSVPLCYIMSKENPIANNQDMLFDRLKDQTYVCFGDLERHKISYWSNYKSHHISFMDYKKILILYDYDMIYDFISHDNNSFAYGCIPYREMIEEFNLFTILDETTPPYELGYIVNKNKIITQEMQCLIGELIEIVDFCTDVAK